MGPQDVCRNRVARESRLIDEQDLAPTACEKHGGWRAGTSRADDDGVVHRAPPRRQTLPDPGARRHRADYPRLRRLEMAAKPMSSGWPVSRGFIRALDAFAADRDHLDGLPRAGMPQRLRITRSRSDA